MRRYIIPFFLILLLPGFCRKASAQKDTTKLNQQVEVVKAYKPSISNAEKISLLPEISDTTLFRPDLNYQTTSHPITSGFQSSVLKPSNQFQREIIIPGFGKIQGGFGTYFTPFFDFYLSNPNSKNGTLGVQINHLSSQGKTGLKGGSEIEAPFSTSRGIVFGSYVIKGATISSEFSYQRDMNKFYGYPVAIPANIGSNNFVKYFGQNQLNQYGYFDFAVKSNASSKSDFKYNTGLNVSYFNTSTDQVEKAIRIKGDFEKDFGSFTGKLSGEVEQLETDNVAYDPYFFALAASPKSTWLKAAPGILFQNDIFSFEGGLNFFAVFNDLNRSILKAYPRATLTIRTSDNNFTFYAGLDGNMQNNSYTRIVTENRWINPFLDVKPTNNVWIISGGVKGKIAAPLSYNLGVRYNYAKDQYFYVTRVTPSLSDLTYDNAFGVVYDNMGTIDFQGDLSYTTPTVFLHLNGHFYTYQLTWLDKAPYMPDFTLNVVSGFRVTAKISATAELYITGPRNVMLKYYQSPVSSATVPSPIYLQTDAMVEANIGAKYQFSKHLEFFGKAENLFNRKDEPWYGYTVQGLRFKLGAGFSF
ncbi:MAG TPA: hypothetical protein VIK10_01105 [Prolixibacteraceae bacterium]